MAKRKKSGTAFGRKLKGLGLAVILLALAIGAVYLVQTLRALPAQKTESVPAQVQMTAVPESELDTARFSQSGDRISYPGAVLGIDVSSHQGQIDWQSVAADGISFVILRVGYRGYTEGEICLDERFADNLAGARAAGLEIGVYFFSQAVSEEEAAEEAQFVLDALDGASLDCPVYFDWEEILTDSARTAQVESGTLTACAQAFCARIEQAGYTAGIYFNQDYGYRQYDLSALTDYAFWLAEYADAPSFRYAVGLWQYTDAGTVAGISEQVDLNLRFTAS